MNELAQVQTSATDEINGEVMVTAGFAYATQLVDFTAAVPLRIQDRTVPRPFILGGAPMLVEAHPIEIVWYPLEPEASEGEDADLLELLKEIPEPMSPEHIAQMRAASPPRLAMEDPSTSEYALE